MVQAPNIASLLDTPSEQVAAPPTFPAGSYLCVVKGQPRQDKSTKKGTEFLEYTLQPVQALEDVDPDALAEFGDIREKTLKATYYITENSLFMLKEFLDACGVEEGGTLRARANQAQNAQVIATVRHESSQDGRRVFARIASVSPVTE